MAAIDASPWHAPDDCHPDFVFLDGVAAFVARYGLLSVVPGGKNLNVHATETIDLVASTLFSYSILY